MVHNLINIKIILAVSKIKHLALSRLSLRPDSELGGLGYTWDLNSVMGA